MVTQYEHKDYLEILQMYVHEYAGRREGLLMIIIIITIRF